MPTEVMSDMAKMLAGAPRERWLALSPDETKIVGVGRTLEEALEQARKEGTEEPVVVWSPKVWRATGY